MKGSFVLLIAVFVVLSSVSIKANKVVQLTSANIGEEPELIEIQSITLLEEGFEDATMPPSGWTLINDQNPPYTWHIVDDSDADVGVNSGTYAAKVTRYIASAQDERLITPEFDLTGYATITLEFWAASWTWHPSATVKVLIQYDETTDVVWDMIQDETWETVEYRNVILDLSSYVDETITICFQYVGIQGWHFGLDDILLIAGDPTIPPELEIGEITGGWAGFGNGGKISAEIKNVAEQDSDDARDVEWSITAIGNGLLQEINESANDTIPVIAPGDLETVELTAGRHLGIINVTVTAYEPYYNLFVSKSADGFVFIGFVIIFREG